MRVSRRPTPGGRTNELVSSTSSLGAMAGPLYVQRVVNGGNSGSSTGKHDHGSVGAGVKT